MRFSFRRSGELIGPPFVTYAPPGAKPDTRQAWRRTITTALESCAPLTFSPRFAAAVAGKPLSVRFVDDRKVKAARKTIARPDRERANAIRSH